MAANVVNILCPSDVIWRFMPLSTQPANTVNPKPEKLSVLHNSELCHPRRAFKLYGEVKPVKNTTIKYG